MSSLAHTRQWLKRSLRALAIVAGILLAGIMLLTALEVLMRYAFNRPMFGAHEFTEYAMLALIMLAIPYCADTNGHIRVDVLDARLGEAGRWCADVIGAAVSLFVLSLLIWRTLTKALDAMTYEDVSNMLQFPLWPFYGLIAIGMAGYVLIVALDLSLLLVAGRASNGRSGADE